MANCGEKWARGGASRKQQDVMQQYVILLRAKLKQTKGGMDYTHEDGGDG